MDEITQKKGIDGENFPEDIESKKGSCVIPHPLKCNVKYHLKPGMYYISSPGFPAIYPHNFMCRYLLKPAKKHQRISLQCLVFLLETSKKCINDFFFIHTGKRSYKLCQPCLPKIDRAALLYIKFRSNSALAAQGYLCRVIVH